MARRRARRVLPIVGLVLLGACQRDYEFHTVAVYEAPRGGYTIRIEGRGLVRAGHDLSERASGVMELSPSTPRGPVPIRVGLSLQDSRVQIDLDSDPVTVVLSRRLTGAGYTVHAGELEELASAAEGVLMGPKGTLMPDQTKVLRVISVTFDR